MSVMSKTDILTEELTKTTHSMEFALRGLQAALNASNGIEGILILDMIETAAKLELRIKNMLDAI